MPPAKPPTEKVYRGFAAWTPRYFTVESAIAALLEADMATDAQKLTRLMTDNDALRAELATLQERLTLEQQAGARLALENTHLREQANEAEARSRRRLRTLR